MSNKIFTREEIEILSNNRYVKHVSAKGITYIDEFKRIFISEHEKGKFPRVIKEYMAYYNNYRYQWELKKMTPVQYRNHLLNSL